MFDLIKAAEQDREFINSTWEKLDKKLSVVAVRSRNIVPYTSIDGRHVERVSGIQWWTNGFWGGLMWLMYCGTKNDEYKLSAEKNEELLDKAFETFWGLHHDVGFMWHLTAGVNYRLTGNEKSKIRAMYAANLLASRYNAAGNFIRAWNCDRPCCTIIDSMMNVPLLYWASREIGDPRYKHMATKHADTTIQNHIRPDGSVKHICLYDEETGEYKEHIAGQGFSVDSAWSRGQAWALYGFALSYIHTGKQEYLDTAKRVAHYFIANICDDYLPKADFRAPEEPVLYDSTAAACAACGLLEIARNVGEYEGKIYYNAAIKLLKALDENCCNYDIDEDSVVQLGTEHWTKNTDEIGKTANIPIIYGDYYFTEAIYKLKGFELLFE